jgi:PhnB protein
MGSVPDTSNITVSISGAESDQIRGYWDGLAAGGQVAMPLDQAPWGDYFGQLTDKFGVSWMVNIAGSGAAQG